MKTEKINKLSYLFLVVLGYSTSMEKENFPIKLNGNENLTTEDRELIKKLKAMLDSYNNNLLNKKSTSIDNVPKINYKDMEEILKKCLKNKNININQEKKSLIDILNSSINKINNKNENFQHIQFNNLANNYKEIKKIEEKNLENTKEINEKELKVKDLYKKNSDKNHESVHMEINKCYCEIM